MEPISFPQSAEPVPSTQRIPSLLQHRATPPPFTHIELEQIQSDNRQWTRAHEWQAFVEFWTGQNHELTSSSTFPYALAMNVGSAWQGIPTYNGIGSTILVTEGLNNLYKRIQLHLKLDLIDWTGGTPKRPHSLKDVIITGQPGSGMSSIRILLRSIHRSVGKSISLWFLTIRLLQDYPTEPLLIVQPWGTLLFYRRSSFFSPSLQTHRDFPRTNIFSLRDDDSELTPSCMTLVKWDDALVPTILMQKLLLCVCARSSKQSLTRDFEKHKNPFQWGMPTWTLGELREG